MSLVREIVSLGRAARMGAKLKVRQPLAKVEVILADRTHQPWLEEHSALIAEELNVKQVEFAEQADQYITYTVLPDLKRLGPRSASNCRQLQAGAGRGRRGGAAWPDWKPTGKSRSTWPTAPVRARRARPASPPASQARLGRGARHRRAWWCCRPSSTTS